MVTPKYGEIGIDSLDGQWYAEDTLDAPPAEPVYKPHAPLGKLLERVELRPNIAETVTFVYSHYVLGVKQLTAITLPYSHWHLMDHAKVRNVGAVIVDMESAPILEDDPDMWSASEQTRELGSY